MGAQSVVTFNGFKLVDKTGNIRNKAWQTNSQEKWR
jgi:hypothetical protein